MSQVRIQRLPEIPRSKSARSDYTLQFQDDRGRAQTRKSHHARLRMNDASAIPRSESTRRPQVRRTHSVNQNHAVRSSRSVSEHTFNKNIPMEEERRSRPQVKKWNSFHGPDREMMIPRDSSVFSVIEDRYDTRQLPHYSWNSNVPNSSTDNLFKALEEPSPTSEIEIPEEAPRGTSLYEKMSKLIIRAQNSVGSLVPLSLKNPQSGSASDTRSESSDSSDSEEEVVRANNTDTQYTIESWKSPPALQPVNTDSLAQILDEINEFHGNFVDKNVNHSDVIGLNRTQQRILDYKQLYEYEEVSKPGLSSYELKIQNETILSQYTSIRLRFSSHEIMSSKKHMVKTDTGVLGFVNRAKNFGLGSENKNNEVTLENKDMFLQKIWDDEYYNCFVDTNHETIEEKTNDDVKSISSEVGIYNQDKLVDMSNLAKSVKFGRS
ncbi:uncharacterized protein SPAPADRAFT_61701 [Spathaspora passalidarum NRRL Y-27907]|uniref:Uncharacterized protein n=1 Tax=Spathaspora passalidarum (strain NRRL Y-27907 / 11-Y1) TaxID=619300 RepID=G3AP70_SPAPN|nr:uncharacterized protein SPAPADRAFT_61701 [Spathaspora passalidarum NRRL Y-27907]EGW32641.1 hypothetical protein SPAPADRAFT_61701 [Spathaspora passalidarum NRRL Y-27907]